MKKLLFPLIGAALLLQSCTIEKRHFRPGYHIEWKTKTWNPPPSAEITTPLTEKEPVPVTPSVSLENTNVTVRDGAGTVDKTVKEETAEVPEISLFEEPKDDTCDVLIKMNGHEISARVIKITPVSIEYKRCDVPDGPLYVEKKSAVFMIKFQNGTKEVFSKEKKEEEFDEGQKTLGIAPFSILFTVYALIF